MTNPEISVNNGEKRNRVLSVTIQQFTSGDPEVFSALYPAMRRWATPIVGAHNADDAAQEAWITVNKRLTSGAVPELVDREEGNVVGYVRKAVINAARMNVRVASRRTARERSAHNLTSRLKPDREEFVESRHSEEDLVERLRRLGMSERVLEPYLLVYRDGLSYDQVKIALGITHDQLRGRLNWATKKIKEISSDND